MAVYIECPRKPRPTMYETLAAAGYPERAPKKPRRDASSAEIGRYLRLKAEHDALVERQKARVMPHRPGTLFICGEGMESEPLCECGHTAELLCDHDVGDGRTCDKRVCWCCSANVGPDRDLCREHAAIALCRDGRPALRLVK